MAAKFKACSIDNCNGNADKSGKGCRGYCRSHYERHLKYGDPLGGNATKAGYPLKFIESAITDGGNECLIWPYGKSSHGYGQLAIDGRMVMAHRYVCKIAKGYPPSPEHEAAHRCGIRACVNPKHLRWASPAENQADRLVHGTDSRGEKHGSAKLTEEQVREIRSLKGLESQSSIAKRFGVSKGCIYGIHRGRIWSWL